MRKKIILITFSLLAGLSLVSCNDEKDNNEIVEANEGKKTEEESTDKVSEDKKTEEENDNKVNDTVSYGTKAINIYRDNSKVDKTIDLRFYENMPHEPYIGVSNYYKKFFNMNLNMTNDESLYTYTNGYNGYYKFDTNSNVMIIYDINTFSVHSDFTSNNSKIFIGDVEDKRTTLTEKAISLNNYSIDIYGDDEAYVPLSLLSSLSGGGSHYNVAYNGKSIYVLDVNGELSNGVSRDYKYYGDSYVEVMEDLDTPRYEDMAIYNYNQLCFNFDNLRGYTTQLSFGDNNLLLLGTNGLLERYYPSIKNNLLSLDKRTYYKGYSAFMIGMYDGGHTSVNMNNSFISMSNSEVMADSTYSGLTSKMKEGLINTLIEQTIFGSAKNNLFGYDSNNNANLYYYDDSSKTAYISFDQFIIDHSGWYLYYNNGMKEEDIPVLTDTYAFVRDSLYKAVNDNASNIVLDLSTNGGGNTMALIGLYGLFNKEIGLFESNNTVNMYRESSRCKIDINLDGKFDELDLEEANKFDFNVAVLTSGCSFSCGNLLPSMFRELGFKIIGEKSGGGSCYIRLESTADGLVHYHSSFGCISNISGENIDSGVKVDYEMPIPEYDLSIYFDSSVLNSIDASGFYDLNKIANYLNS